MNRRERRARARAKAPRAAAPSAALEDAIRRHRSGDLAAAEKVYLEELARHPAQPDALHFLGVLRHQQQRSEEGLALVTRALAIAPDNVDAWNNLGNIHKESGRLQGAEEAYKHALALDFDHAGAWNNLGIVLRVTGRAPEAVGALRRAVECAPAMAEHYFNLGNALRDCKLLRDAIAAFRRVIELDPRHVRAHQQLGRTLYLAGERQEAEGVFRAWSAIEPANPVAAHMLAACSGESVPSRASDDFVRVTFDGFADSFDEILLQRLDYHAPDLLVAALTDVLGDPQASLDVLDAGCGTGPCGPLLEPFARTLVGVDLSAGMLAKARMRDVYDTLFEDELTRFLDAREASFDVVASADTLCYFGDLAAVTRAARRSLRSGGWIGFTLERANDVDGYRLNPHGRYSHGRDYVVRTLHASGFMGARADPGVLRMEAGQPVEGWVVTARAG